MTTVVLFHSALGLGAGMHDAATRLEAAGHAVVLPDLFDGRVFDDYEPGVAYAFEEVGYFNLLPSAAAAVRDLPDGFVVGGFSLGCAMAMHVATTRSVGGALMFAGIAPPSELGTGASWPAAMPAQMHAMIDDPWDEPEMLTKAVAEAAAARATLEVFGYPGSGHLFTDPSRAREFDKAAADLQWERVLEFLARLP
jgi:dienelactone hydrolase